MPTPMIAPDTAVDRSSEDNAGPAVRFKSTVQEIDPQLPLSELSAPGGDHAGDFVTPEDIRALSKSLQGHRLQERRMNNFAFEPYSLPASRVRLDLFRLLYMFRTSLCPVATILGSAHVVAKAI
jgi:hypothetical protein